MILILKPELDSESEDRVLDRLHELGINAQLVRTSGRAVVVLKSDVTEEPNHRFTQIEGVVKAVRLSPGYSLASSIKNKSISIVASAAGYSKKQSLIGSGHMPLVMAGPCSVESAEQILEVAVAVKDAGASVLRAGAFKPRTSPYEFQGLKEEGLEYLKEASKQTGLPIVTEVLSPDKVETVAEFADILQIGTRNMYNYELLREAGRLGRPVLLKRGMSATIDELLYAAEYVLKEGNEQVILCERGIRTFESRLRNTLDLSAVPLLKSLSGLPVVVDPSHATGLRAMVRPMARAAIACGADGLLLEVHDRPEQSISDAEQAIDPGELASVVKDMVSIVLALGLGAGSGDSEESAGEEDALGAVAPCASVRTLSESI